MVSTIPRSAERRALPVTDLADAYQAAAAAGERSPARQWDRSLQAEWYPDGVALIGVSSNLVVCAQVAYIAGSPSALYEQVLEAEPLMRVVVNDSAAGGRGRSTLKDGASRSRSMPKGSSPLRATFYLDEVVPEGAMVGTRYLRIAVDGMTDGELIGLGTWSPAPWREGLPDADSTPTVPASALLREHPGAFARMARVTAHLPLDEGEPMDWQFHTLASGRVVRYLRLDGESGVTEVSVACALDARSSRLPLIFAQTTDPTPTDDEDPAEQWPQLVLGEDPEHDASTESDDTGPALGDDDPDDDHEPGS